MGETSLSYLCVCQNLGSDPGQCEMSWRLLFPMKEKVKGFGELALYSLRAPPDSSLPFIFLPLSYSLFLLPNKQHSQTTLLLSKLGSQWLIMWPTSLHYLHILDKSLQLGSILSIKKVLSIKPEAFISVSIIVHFLRQVCPNLCFFWGKHVLVSWLFSWSLLNVLLFFSLRKK